MSPGFFSALGVKLIAGRDFNEGDRADGERVVIISESLAPGTYYVVLYNVPRDTATGTGSDNTESVAVQLGLTVFPTTSQAPGAALSIGRPQFIHPN